MSAIQQFKVGQPRQDSRVSFKVKVLRTQSLYDSLIKINHVKRHPSMFHVVRGVVLTGCRYITNGRSQSRVQNHAGSRFCVRIRCEVRAEPHKYNAGLGRALLDAFTK